MSTLTLTSMSLEQKLANAKRMVSDAMEESYQLALEIARERKKVPGVSDAQFMIDVARLVDPEPYGIPTGYPYFAWYEEEEIWGNGCPMVLSFRADGIHSRSATERILRIWKELGMSVPDPEYAICTTGVEVDQWDGHGAFDIVIDLEHNATDEAGSHPTVEG